MLIHKPADVPPSEITPRSLFERRRNFLARSGTGLVAGAALWHGLPGAARASTRLQTVPSALSTTEPLSERDAVTGYNNFYEFGTDKADPARNAHKMEVRPWTVRVEAWSASRAASTSTSCCAWHRWKNASTACAASKAGPWWCPGWASRSPRC